jgi:hypothetical protein
LAEGLAALLVDDYHVAVGTLRDVGVRGSAQNSGAAVAVLVDEQQQRRDRTLQRNDVAAVVEVLDVRVDALVEGDVDLECPERPGGDNGHDCAPLNIERGYQRNAAAIRAILQAEDA